MAKTQETKQASDYIVPLNINGLQGRMLHMPAPKGKKREFLYVYGHHSTLERWYGLVTNMNQYGAVTMPDLPGFGGMESFYKIGQKATIDNLADYLAAFIKLRYKHKKVTIVGASFGFVIVTRMLQRCPDLTKKVELLVSVVGFAHKDDFVFTPTRHFLYRVGSSFFSHRLPAIFFKNVMIHPLILRAVYARTHNAKKKFAEVDKSQRKALMDFEVHLWHANDVRTHWKTVVEFLTLDNCKQRVDLPVWHISVKADRYFDNYLIEQHMKIIFNKFTEAKANLDSHAPSILAEAEETASMLPRKIRKLFEQG
jgi:pimeloyl-ACP methyl ester carboxylesterase